MQSGSHETFSRFVIYNENPGDWRLGRVEGGYEFRLPDAGSEFGIDGVLGRLSEGRIADVQDRGDGRLFIQVTCACFADVFAIPQGLVLDIRDGEPTENARFEDALDAINAQEDPKPMQDMVPTAQPLEAPDVASLIERRVVPRIGLSLLSEASGSRRDQEMPIVGTVPPDPIGRRDILPNAINTRAEDLREELFQQLGRAALQGLVEAEISRPKTSEERQAAGEGEQAKDFPDAEAISNSDHLRFETAIERARLDGVGADPTTNAGALCFPDDWFDVASWNEDELTHAGFFVGRTSILGEFDAVDAEAVTTLARRYLYLTFGAETRELLLTFESTFKNTPAMLALADIMDFGSSRLDAIPVEQITCDARVAMWALLANEDVSVPETINSRAVLSAFSELPLHLRRHLGPYLAERFLQIGDMDSVHSIMSNLERAPGDLGEHYAMVSAEVALRSGDVSAGIDELEAVVRQNGTQSADATVRLIEESIENDVSLPNEMPVVAAALAHEAKGTELAEDLVRVQLQASANQGNASLALSQTTEAFENGEIEFDTAQDLYKDLVEQILQEGRDVSVLEVATNSKIDLGAGGRANEIRQNLAQYLIGIGISGLAREILSKNGTSPTDDDRILLAESFLIDGNSNAVIETLVNLDTPAAKRLRARAFLAANNHAMAAQIFASLGDQAAESEALWRAEGWDAVASSGDGPKQVAASLLRNSAIQNDADLGMLARGTDLVSKSQRSRQVLQNLMDSLEEN